MSGILDRIQSAIAELEQIRTETQQSSNFEIGKEKVGRWKNRTEQVINEIISPEEGKKFGDKHLGAYSMDRWRNFNNEVEIYNSHLLVLKDEIDRNPDFYIGLIKSNDVAKPTTIVKNISPMQRLETICHSFHNVARQLRVRYDKRSTIEVSDEYDVQDLFHALLKIDFEDIRREEWNPSYAGSSSRSDFLLKNEQVVVEIKKTRLGLADKVIGEQLLVDIAKYSNHPDCKTLVCFIYDPDGLIGNPIGLTNDLEQSVGIDVKIIIAPQS